jgi:hypothetical protein
MRLFLNILALLLCIPCARAEESSRATITMSARVLNAAELALDRHGRVDLRGSDPAEVKKSCDKTGKRCEITVNY